mmetsp:Transcript_4294/g.9367  ORF Transcript_4294/g.9367 Transcript_4294/m.9367 type:complete len:218 (-) Transcript_4294:1554-2207(-)
MHKIEAAMEVVPDISSISPTPKNEAATRPAVRTPTGIPYSSKNSFGSSGRRKRSSIFPETRNPPAILTKDNTVATAPIQCAGESGMRLALEWSPEAKRSMPPMAVHPEMAFVTAINGECRAGATPHTTWYPARPARPNVAMRLTEEGESAVRPNPTKRAAAALAIMEFLTKEFLLSSSANAFSCSGVSSTTSAAASCLGGGGGVKGTILSGHLALPP